MFLRKYLSLLFCRIIYSDRQILFFPFAEARDQSFYGRRTAVGFGGRNKRMPRREILPAGMTDAE